MPPTPVARALPPLQRLGMDSVAGGRICGWSRAGARAICGGSSGCAARTFRSAIEHCSLDTFREKTTVLKNAKAAGAGVRRPLAEHAGEGRGCC